MTSKPSTEGGCTGAGGIHSGDLLPFSEPQLWISQPHGSLETLMALDNGKDSLLFDVC